jgi:hypothetical protein
MTRIRFAAIAGCIVALAAGAVSAQATPGGAATTAATTAASSRPGVAPEQQDARRSQGAGDGQLICARIEVPARRVRPRICRTRAQWEQEFGGLPTR